jgi:prepilin-type N-terminal cleavage/methylation domain-containing protein
MRSSREPSRGFTLVELAITILIVGMLIAMGIPAINSMSQSQMLTSNVENIAAQLRMARQRAISVGSAQVVHFTQNFPAVGCDYHIHNGGYIVPLGKLGPGVSYYYGTGVVTSYQMQPDGTCQNSGLVILQNARGKMDTVSVQVSGLVLTK